MGQVSQVDLTVTEAEVRRVLPLWDVGELSCLPGERGGTANPAVVVVIESGRYFLKRRNPRYSAPEVLRHDHALMAHLAAKGLCTPLGVVCREGRRWVEVGDRVYELYPYMPGDPHDPRDEAQLTEAGRQLAAFHRAAEDFALPPGKEWPRYHDPANTIVALEWAEEELKSLTGLTPAGRERADALREVRRLLAVSRELAAEFTDEQYHGYPKLVVHGDWHPANVKYDGNRICGIFDLDWATRQPRLVDIADGIIYFAGERAGRMDPSDIRTLTAPFVLDSHRIRRFMEGYLKAGELAGDELRGLTRFLLARWLYCRADPMRRKIPREEAIDYLLDGIWEPVATIRRVDTVHKGFT